MNLRLALLSVCIIALTTPRAIGADAADRPPNILIVLADDMGFSDIGSYGGEIRTPNLDRLAADGIRFTQFYNTARCWPTRAALLTGYYPQAIRMDPPRGRLPQWARLLPHHLKPAGYRSYHSGKWHVRGAPKAVADGGFDHSYVIHDHDRHFYPDHHELDDQRLPPVKPTSDYYSSTAIADHAIRCLKEHAESHADKPFFSYVAFLAPHFPLHAPAEDIARYRQRYTQGWDALREERMQRLRKSGIATGELPPKLPEWTPRYFKPTVMDELGAGEVKTAVDWQSLNEEQKQFQAAKMAVHAAMVDRMDQEIGRILDQLRAMNATDDTLVLFLSDNGADATLLIRGDRHDPSAEPGSADSYLCLGPGWATASNTPFTLHKIWTYEGGISTPLIAHWPKGISARGELRRTPGHVVDLVPTVLELAGVAAGTTSNGVEPPPMAGVSLVPLFARDGAIERDGIYFNHEGNRALRVGDWKIVSARERQNEWELYDLSNDRGETRDLAAEQPERLAAMRDKWQALTDQYEKLAATP